MIRDAHRERLLVHAWTFRAENQFLPVDFRIGADPNARGDITAEYELFLGLGLDGVFSRPSGHRRRRPRRPLGALTRPGADPLRADRRADHARPIRWPVVRHPDGGPASRPPPGACIASRTLWS